MSRLASPLRYPGGKGVLAPFIAQVLRTNGLQGGDYAEPYAGGAGAALSLLFGEHVHSIILNDADPRLYAFWNAVLNKPQELIERVLATPVNLAEWRRQRAIYRNPTRQSRIGIALATFFLNRCNRSGIIVNGGPIGGMEQRGEWRLDARFNKKDLIRRIERIAGFRERISFYNMDALDFMKQVILKLKDPERTLVYLDPPYYEKGSQLYLNSYKHGDHAELADFLGCQRPFPWLMTYDDVPAIRLLHRRHECIPFQLAYTAQVRKYGRELLIHSRELRLPGKERGRVSNLLSSIIRAVGHKASGPLRRGQGTAPVN